MSREYYDTLRVFHEGVARDFATAPVAKARHVEIRVTDDALYVYLYEDGVHIQTQTVDIPEHWSDNWPSDATVRRYVHRYAEIGPARITSLDA